jgi:uncharacterized protein
MRRATMTLCILLGTSLSVAAMAGSITTEPVTIAQGTNHFPGTEDHVRIVAVARDRSDQNQVTVTLRIDPGYHVNANPASQKDLIPTTLIFDGPQPRQVVYPPPTRFQPKFTDEAIDVYQGTVSIIAIFPQGALSPTVRLRGTLLAQACTDEICLPPAEIALRE